MTLSAAQSDIIIDNASFAAAQIKAAYTDARLLGIHLEGPFISDTPTGAAEKGVAVPPNLHTLDKYIEASCGHIRIVTAAPDPAGALELIKYAVSKGIAVSCGHTTASYDEAKLGFDAGMSRVTHMYNAMTGLHHRSPGVVGAVFSSKTVEAELICDFFHVHPDVVKLTLDILGAERITMITDAEVGAGMPDGRYYGSSQRFLNVRGVRTYTDDGIICGGTSFMIDGVRNLVSIGIPLEKAVKTASLNPARALHMENMLGSISVGKYADLLVLDRDLGIRKIFVGGREIIR